MGIKGYIVGLCSCLLLWACQKEEVENPFGSVKPGEVQLSFSTEGLLRRHVVATKGDVKTAEEQEGPETPADQASAGEEHADQVEEETSEQEEKSSTQEESSEEVSDDQEEKKLQEGEA